MLISGRLPQGVESVGFGRFQILLLILCGATQLADATELLVLSLLNNPVQCAFGVTKSEAAWLASAVFAGMLVGAYVTGHVSDQYGRRVGFGMTTTLVAAFGLVSAGAPSFELLVLARFFVGVGVGGANAALSLFTEYLPSSMRGRGLIFFFLFFSVGGVMEAGLAYLLMPDWRALLLVTALPSVALVLVFPLVPESPRFLVVRGRIDEAERSLARAAACNGAKLPNGRLRPMEKVPKRGAQPMASFVSEVQRLLKTGVLRHLSLSLWALFFLMAVLYYALVQLTVSLSIPGLFCYTLGLFSYIPGLFCYMIAPAESADRLALHRSGAQGPRVRPSEQGELLARGSHEQRRAAGPVSRTPAP